MSIWTLHPQGIYQIRLPMGNPEWINSYLIPDGEGYALVDTGFHTDAFLKVWQEVSEQIGFTFDQITKIIITHHHPDHFGLAGWFQGKSQAPVYISELGLKQAEALWGEGGRPLVSYFLKTYEKHGLEPQLYKQLKEQLENNAQLVLPFPKCTVIREGEVVSIGNQAYEIIHLPGHAAGHIALYNKEQQLIFVGDEVMPDSLPDTCFVSEEFDRDPTNSYIQSLEKLKKYDVLLAFPGHHQPFTRFNSRLEQLLYLHEERQQKIEQQFSKTEWKTAYEAYYGVFEPIESLNQKRFHFTETISRVQNAAARGVIEQSEQDGVLRYRKI